MNDTAPSEVPTLGYPTAAQVALRLQHVDLDELAEDISFEHMPGSAVIVVATIVRRISQAEYLTISKPYPLLGTPKRDLATAPPGVRAEYRRQYDERKATLHAVPLWVHPDEIDRLAAEIETAIAGILG